jgi:hypothetical protein
MAIGFVDGVFFLAASSGTGNFVVSSAITGYQTPAAAGALNATTYYYRAQSNDLTQWEIGRGAYTVSGTTLARTVILFNNLGTTAAINFSAAPNVGIIEPAEMMPAVDTTLVTGSQAHGVMVYEGAQTPAAATSPMFPGQILIGQPGMTFSNIAAAFNQATGTTMTAQGGASAGQTIVVLVNMYTSNVQSTSVTDSVGNTYTLGVQTAQTVGVYTTSVYYSNNIANAIVNASTTFTVNCAGANYSADVWALVGATGGVVGTPQTFVNAGATTTATLTQTGLASNSFCFGVVGWAVAQGAGAGNFTIDPEPWINIGHDNAVAYNFAPSGGTVSWSPSWISESGVSAVLICFGITSVADPQPFLLNGDQTIFDNMGRFEVVNVSNGTTGTSLWTPTTGIFDPTNSQEIWCCLDANYTLTSTTGSQKIFNASAAGTLTIPTNIYFFEGLLYITSMSGTSGNALLNILGAGTATVDSILWFVTGADTTTPTAVTTTGFSWVLNSTNSTPASATLAETGTGWSVFFKGVLRTSAYGSVIPSLSLVTAAAAVVNKNSYIRFTPMTGWASNTNYQTSTFGRFFGANAWS